MKNGFNLVSIFIFAGEVDNRIDAQPGDIKANHIGGEGRVTPWIIRDGYRVNALRLSRPLSNPQNVVLGFSPGSPSGNEFKSVDKLLPLKEGLSESVLLHGGTTGLRPGLVPLKEDLWVTAERMVIR